MRVRCVCFILASLFSDAWAGCGGCCCLREAVRGVLCCALPVNRLGAFGVANPYVSNGFSGCVAFVCEQLFLRARSCVRIAARKKNRRVRVCCEKKNACVRVCGVCSVTFPPYSINFLRSPFPSISFCSPSRSVLSFSPCASFLLCLLACCCCYCRFLLCSRLYRSTLSRYRFLCKLFTTLLAVVYTCLTCSSLSRWESVSLLSCSTLREFCRVGD
jgi:hypothetical protein